jgi:ABC-2 type transport system permease protein
MSFGDVLAMEWIKLRSLRSTTWVLAAGMLVTAALGMVAGFNTRSVTGDPTSNVLSGVILGQVVVGVLGVLCVTSEYSSGLIRVTLAAVPRRRLVLAAKACAFGALALVAGEVAVFAAFLGGIAVLRPSVPHPALSDPTVLRAVALTGAYLGLVALMGVGVGILVRHSAAAVAILVGGLFVGNSLAAVNPVQGFNWSPWLELGITALYPAVLLTAGCIRLTRQDA